MKTVLAYMYEVMGGSARHLLQFGETVDHDPTSPLMDIIPAALEEALGASEYPAAVRDAVNKECAKLLSVKLRCTESAEPFIISVFYREIVVAGDRWQPSFTFVGASAALRYLELELLTSGTQEVVDLLKSIIKSSAVGYAYEHRALRASFYRELKRKGTVNLVEIDALSKAAVQVHVDQSTLHLVNMRNEGDIASFQAGHFAFAVPTKSKFDEICILRAEVKMRVLHIPTGLPVHDSGICFTD
jgi:hypothetical protein